MTRWENTVQYIGILVYFLVSIKMRSHFNAFILNLLNMVSKEKLITLISPFKKKMKGKNFSMLDIDLCRTSININESL